LWAWLRNPSETVWRRRLAALGADFLIRKETLEAPTITQLDEELLGGAAPAGPDPELVSIDAQTRILGRMEGLFGVRLLARFSVDAVKGTSPRLPNWTLRLFDDQHHRQDRQFEASWRAFLQAMNLLQFSPGFWFTSSEDLDMRRTEGADLYPLPRPDDGYSIAAEPPPESYVQADPLEALELLDEERVVVEAVLAAGGAAPEVGHELVDGQGRCVAEAQLAWPGVMVAVVADGEPADRKAFERDGWRVFVGLAAVDDLVSAVTD